ncbi:hypothetical protein BKA67DRAFT_560936 [Truncatella angustata]|uniref:Uncharacterized protein n=1 Tax=Truncatella angustata TaxID=152316 RepID=A0A9P8UNU6_9PEZI|nr:uncharacterized protein BKA67DRAFT_560936 [Truncatella angustata]KAH6655512.1 hypothetical protein BKA67DRAFT_560936 [Truncatella angustata]
MEFESENRNPCHEKLGLPFRSIVCYLHGLTNNLVAPTSTVERLTHVPKSPHAQCATSAKVCELSHCDCHKRIQTYASDVRCEAQEMQMCTLGSKVRIGCRSSCALSYRTQCNTVFADGENVERVGPSRGE